MKSEKKVFLKKTIKTLSNGTIYLQLKFQQEQNRKRNGQFFEEIK